MLKLKDEHSPENRLGDRETMVITTITTKKTTRQVARWDKENGWPWHRCAQIEYHALDTLSKSKTSTSPTSLLLALSFLLQLTRLFLLSRSGTSHSNTPPDPRCNNSQSHRRPHAHTHTRRSGIRVWSFEDWNPRSKGFESLEGWNPTTLKTVRSSHRTILKGFRVSRRVLKGFRVSSRGKVEARGRGWLLELSPPLQQQSSVELGSEHNGSWRSLCEELSIFVMKVCDVSLTLCIFFSLSF